MPERAWTTHPECHNRTTLESMTLAKVGTLSAVGILPVSEGEPKEQVGPRPGLTESKGELLFTLVART